MVRRRAALLGTLGAEIDKPPPGEYLSAMALPLRPVVVTRLEPSGPDTWTLYWKRSFDFLPGQVVALSILSAGEQRLYSLATGQNEDEAGVLFNLAPGGWLTPQLAAVRPGHQLYCSQPFGSFAGFSGPAVWVANGTGVAPFLAMVRSGLTAEKILVHGARYRAHFYGQDLLAPALGDRYLRCASADSGDGLVAGRLTGLLESRSWPADRPYYLCGSASMVVEARDILIRRGVPFKNILSEVYF
jgi:ferredoxin--NADP+ reductase